jgi:hypothetical protein
LLYSNARAEAGITDLGSVTISYFARDHQLMDREITGRMVIPMKITVPVIDDKSTVGIVFCQELFAHGH